MKRLIIFDMDGTLYDLSDVMSAVYETQVSFLQERMGWERPKAIQLLKDHDIEPQVTRESKSATELFFQLGFGRQDWTEYRQERFPIGQIDPNKAVKASLLGRFAKLGDTVLLTSNTSLVSGRILARIGLTYTLFCKIVCSDTADVAMPFNKFPEMEKLMADGNYETVFSIGDRYQTDIVPALKLGGCGCLVKGPGSLEKVYVDLEHGRLGSCPVYEYYAKCG